MASPAEPEIEAFLPLRHVEYHVLLSLSEGVRHGYRIIQESLDRSGNEGIPDVATLYRALKRMVEAGLIRPTDGPDDTKRRSYYAITPFGKRVAAAESRRMASLVQSAAAAGLLDA